ncbi:MAG: hypothetical protein NVSMB25_11560 [Thermoleophilaceae bacterium]
MSVTPRSLSRTAALVLLVAILQLSGFAAMRIFGSTIDLLPLLVAAGGLYAGAVPGAIVGFCTGLLVDLAVGPDLGATALVLTALGFWVGRFAELRDPSHGLVPLPLAALATAGYLASLTAVSFMLQIQATVSALVLRDALVTVILNVIVALPFFWFVRKVLRPVLAVDPLERRRRRAGPRSSGPIGLRGLEV